ncbi:MAG: hypothetical protein ACMUHB_07585, partial [Thermoplasmatota archaeon]
FNSKARKMDEERLEEALSDLRSEMEGNPAMEVLENWKRLGRPDDHPDQTDLPEVDVVRPQEYLQSSASVFKVQKGQLKRTFNRFLKEMDGWIEGL